MVGPRPERSGRTLWTPFGMLGGGFFKNSAGGWMVLKPGGGKMGWLAWSGGDRGGDFFLHFFLFLVITAKKHTILPLSRKPKAKRVYLVVYYPRNAEKWRYLPVST